MNTEELADGKWNAAVPGTMSFAFVPVLFTRGKLRPTLSKILLTDLFMIKVFDW